MPASSGHVLVTGATGKHRTLCRHVEYVLDLVGDDHVGIALDYVFDRDELDAAVAADPETFLPR